MCLTFGKKFIKQRLKHKSVTLVDQYNLPSKTKYQASYFLYEADNTYHTLAEKIIHAKQKKNWIIHAIQFPTYAETLPIMTIWHIFMSVC